MIAPLRAWHRRIVVLLAILLPLLIILAYTFRVPELPVNELPAEELPVIPPGARR